MGRIVAVKLVLVAIRCRYSYVRTYQMSLDCVFGFFFLVAIASRKTSVQIRLAGRDVVKIFLLVWM